MYICQWKNKNEIKMMHIVYVQYFCNQLLCSNIANNLNNYLNDLLDFENMKRERSSYCFIKH